MDQLIPRRRKMKSSEEQGIPKKKHSNGVATTLLPPRSSLAEFLNVSPPVPHTHASPLAPNTFHIVFCVDQDELEEDGEGKMWRKAKWFLMKIGPGKVDPNPLVPFWTGNVPGQARLVPLGSHIYSFGGMSHTAGPDGLQNRPMRDVCKLGITPRVAKEWIPISLMRSPRCCPQVSLLGSKIFVCNSFYDRLSLHWGEVFDPANGKWKVLPNPPSYPPVFLGRIIISVALKNPDRIIVAYRVAHDPYSAIFYAYNVQNRCWGMLGRRKLHPLCGYRDDVWLERPRIVNNTLYWIDRSDDLQLQDDILFIAYDLDLDMWLEGDLKGFGIFFFQDYQRWGCDGCNGRSPVFRHLEKQRFLLLQCADDDYLRCVVVEVSHMPRVKSLNISVVWNLKYAMEPKICRGVPTVIIYADIL